MASLPVTKKSTASPKKGLIFHCHVNFFGGTLSPIILEIQLIFQGPVFHFHDYVRKGISHRIHGTNGIFTYMKTIKTYKSTIHVGKYEPFPWESYGYNPKTTSCLTSTHTVTNVAKGTGAWDLAQPQVPWSDGFFSSSGTKWAPTIVINGVILPINGLINR